ncbi:putative aminoglycoside phosphotransferase [Gordonia polyisoprenivorans VH2]|uniref:Putative aminoglycoside phosphotransferase n=1 Tax=Gordonia polyisoprenivorans (strain DSM 44266 / VH2) TaxID=1112204 RepID=H6MZV7_GORPV|nr:phosphotransferase family protein [Gordonia polyisoprenivorans]AFA73208.1 putative aminoglycoside phosphotransferase [Gordonia polyisoprenivorans VH2]OZC30329.1 phosphotransferase family protein [Gordonia polyisoprenivorans]
MSSSAATTPDPDPGHADARVAAGLADVLRECTGAGAIEIGDLVRIPAGASRQTWSFVATIDGEPRRLVLRLDPPGGRDASSLLREAALMRAAGAVGVPSPTVIAEGLDDPDIGGDFVVMNHIDGATIPRKILRDPEFADARAALTGQLGAALAAVHSIDVDVVPGLPEDDPLAAWRPELDAADRVFPTFEFALSWLERHRPPTAGRTVTHGDFRIGNVIVDGNGLAAVLDWELAHIGDPLEDLGWMCVKAWRFGGAGMVGGLGGLDEFIGAYEAAGGAPVDREALFWWQVYGTLRWGIICLHQTQRHRTGTSRSVELAAIGRRVSENEWELLSLIG